MSRLAAVSGRSYRSAVPGTLNPIIAMKCMTQMPGPPIAPAAKISSQARWRGSALMRAFVVQCSPTSEPTTDST
jgi:hypothetical protein